jgi:hypothetical protein
MKLKCQAHYLIPSLSEKQFLRNVGSQVQDYTASQPWTLITDKSTTGTGGGLCENGNEPSGAVTGA